MSRLLNKTIKHHITMKPIAIPLSLLRDVGRLDLMPLKEGQMVKVDAQQVSNRIPFYGRLADIVTESKVGVVEFENGTTVPFPLESLTTTSITF
jgi:hypothetical protein